MRDPLKELENENELKNSQKNKDNEKIKKKEIYEEQVKENDNKSEEKTEEISDEELERKIETEKKKQERMLIFVHFASVIVLIITVIACFTTLNNRITDLYKNNHELESQIINTRNNFEFQESTYREMNKEIKEFIRDSYHEFDRMDQIQKRIEKEDKLNSRIFEAFQEYNSGK